MTPGAPAAVEPDLHGPGPRLDDALGGEHVLHLAGPDAEGEGAERPVRGRVGVAADDDHPRAGDAQLGADHVDDALLRRIEVEQLDPELARIPDQRRQLAGGGLVGDRQTPVAGGDVVIDRGHGELGAANLPPREPEPVEGLGRGDLVHQVKVDVEQRRPARRSGRRRVRPTPSRTACRERSRDRGGAALSGAGGGLRRAAAAFASSDHGIMARSSRAHPLDLVVLVGLPELLEGGPPGLVLRQPLAREAAVLHLRRGSGASRRGSPR